MIEFDIRKSSFSQVEGDGLRAIISEVFGDAKKDGEKYVIKCGALQPMTVWLSGKKLAVEITTDSKVDNETAMKSITLKNQFLEKATGYTAKERLKKLKKAESQ